MGLFRDRRYRHLFTAQITALIGTGLTTVGLALLASNLAGADAGQVLGTALAIKMIAYVATSACPARESRPASGGNRGHPTIRYGRMADLSADFPAQRLFWEFYASLPGDNPRYL